MRLEIRRPVGNQGVADAVRFVESVAGKGFNQVKNLYRQLLFETLAQGPVDKPLPFLGHQRGDFLAHRLADRIRFPQGIASEVLQNQQHLVLIDDDPVGFIQQFLQAGMGIGNRRAPVLGFNKGVDMLHRPRPVQRNHRRDVVQARRLQFLDIPLHPRAFQLKQVRSLARGQQGKGRLVIQRQPPQVNLDAPGLVHQLHRPVQDSQVGQPQKVHFQQTQLRHRIHRILGHHYRAVFIPPARPLQRHRLGQRLVGNQDPGGVGADMVDNALQPLGVIHQLMDSFVALIGGLQLRVDPQGIL